MKKPDVKPKPPRQAKPVGIRLTEDQLGKLQEITDYWGAASVTEAVRRLIAEEHRRQKRTPTGAG